ncbi:glutamate synthase subunit beta [Hyphomicrobiales bacterium]|jgi:glutamate synthase (NADPH) small chain|nr:glutamate synthase subunit beta [Rhodobiaceae bacterium]MBT5641437.1 glutamate synthase subunit beta [Rhodobiaceae bacterium]MDB4128182.1 glutamate synthase subunit beta [Hyphomicrobiales bacterium]
MGKVTGFLEIDRHDRKYKPASDRVRNFNEFIIPLGEAQTRDQAARCMDCGIPFCHTGCPVNNQIPDWNDLVYKNDWKKALENLHSTNNFPEFTGRICPAPCESSCTLNLNDEPVTIKTIECAIIDKGWKENWITPKISEIKTGKSIAIVGSGPAGLSCAQQLARQGHSVNVYEKNNKAGGLMRYGIPDFKMEKYLIERRVHQMEEEGVKFHYGVKIESKESIDQLIDNYDAIVLAGGSESSRDLPIPGRELNGVHFAMDFLPNQNRVIGNEEVDKSGMITAAGKNVVVIGGGDTGSDCIGTSFRQGALSVTQLEIMPIPPEKEDKLSTWPNWPLKFRTSSSQAEGASREFSIMTEEFNGDNGSLKALKCVRVDNEMKKIDGSEFEIKADLALLAMGFVHPVHTGIIDTLGIEKDSRGNILADTEKYLTNIEKFFAAGDMRRGQSLVVWAIREGRQAARSVDKFLMGKTNLAR